VSFASLVCAFLKDNCNRAAAYGPARRDSAGYPVDSTLPAKAPKGPRNKLQRVGQACIGFAKDESLRYQLMSAIVDEPNQSRVEVE
jgi:hypothetical protein